MIKLKKGISLDEINNQIDYLNTELEKHDLYIKKYKIKKLKEEFPYKYRVDCEVIFYIDNVRK